MTCSVHHILTLLLIAINLNIIISRKPCSVNYPNISPKYYLIEKCYRSNLGIVAKANFSSLTDCRRFAQDKSGLGFNFSPREAWDFNDEMLDYTCEILKCAESDGGLSLVNDTRYDYYSIYANPLPHVNSTCVPGIGMFFLLSKKLNYSVAANECKNISAVPADITRDHRTDALALLLAGASVDSAFVGLRSKNGSNFISSNGDTLDCTTYRAWAPGHPRKNRIKFNCVLLTRQKTWLSTSCNQSYPMLCESTPRGPYKKGSIFISRNENKNGELFKILLSSTVVLDSNTFFDYEVYWGLFDV